MLEVAGVEVVPLRDAQGSFATMREAFGLEFDDPWVLPFHAYLLRSPARAVLVDSGVGPPGGGFLPGRQGWLPERLAAAGVRPEDVDVVVLTHLHVDHIGWNPLFPRARFVAQREELEYWRALRGSQGYFRRSVLELEPRFDLLDGAAEVAAGIRVEPLRGHTPGHQRVIVGEGADRLELLGDAAVHERQLADPDLAYEAEADQPRAAAARRELLPRLADEGTLVALGHLEPHGLGRIRREGSSFAWSPLDTS